MDKEYIKMNRKPEPNKLSFVSSSYCQERRNFFMLGGRDLPRVGPIPGTGKGT